MCDQPSTSATRTIPSLENGRRGCQSAFRGAGCPVSFALAMLAIAGPSVPATHRAGRNCVRHPAGRPDDGQTRAVPTLPFAWEFRENAAQPCAKAGRTLAPSRIGCPARRTHARRQYRRPAVVTQSAGKGSPPGRPPIAGTGARAPAKADRADSDRLVPGLAAHSRLGATCGWPPPTSWPNTWLGPKADCCRSRPACGDLSWQAVTGFWNCWCSGRKSAVKGGRPRRKNFVQTTRPCRRPCASVSVSASATVSCGPRWGGQSEQKRGRVRPRMRANRMDQQRASYLSDRVWRTMAHAVLSWDLWRNCPNDWLPSSMILSVAGAVVKTAQVSELWAVSAGRRSSAVLRGLPLSVVSAPAEWE